MSQRSNSEKIGKSAQIFTRRFVAVLAIQMAFGISYSAFLMLPKFLRTELGASATEIGLMAGTSLVGSALLAPVVGALAGRFDRRWLLALALLMEGGAALSFTTVTEIGPFAYALRLAQGVACVIVFNCTATIAADEVPQRHLAQAIGYLGLAMLSTNALAPAVTEPLAAALGWHIAFGISGAVALFSVAFVLLLDTSSVSPSPSAVEIRAPGQLGAIYYGSALVGAGLGSMFTYVQPFALAQGATEVGHFFFGYVATAVTVRTVFGGTADRLGPRKVATAALILYALVTASAAFVTPALLVPLGAALGVSHGFIYPALSALGLSLTQPGARSVFMGWFGGAFNTGFAASVLLMGPLADKFGFGAVFLITGAVVATGVAPLLHSSKDSKRENRNPSGAAALVTSTK